MQHQEQMYGETPPAEVPPAEAAATPRTRRWGLPTASRPRRVWLGGGAPTDDPAEGTNAAR